jgi:hypothetical protein
VNTAQLSRELKLCYKQTLTLRQRLQENANETAAESQMTGKHFEADEVYQNAGKKRRALSGSSGKSSDARRGGDAGLTPGPMAASPPPYERVLVLVPVRCCGFDRLADFLPGFKAPSFQGQ